jgi:hypothetical protein
MPEVSTRPPRRRYGTTYNPRTGEHAVIIGYDDLRAIEGKLVDACLCAEAQGLSEDDQLAEMILAIADDIAEIMASMPEPEMIVVRVPTAQECSVPEPVN